MFSKQGTMPSTMKHNFSKVPEANIPRSTFNRSHGYKTTLDAGYLVPFYVDEVLPGDTFNVRANMFGRLTTPLYPIMDNLHLDSFFFAVPIRLIWENFQKMMGEQVDPGDSIDYSVPIMDITAGVLAPAGGGYQEHSLSDYFGIPTEVEEIEHSSLWHRAYNLIYNEWFRDQNLQNSVTVDKDNGPDNPADYVLLKRNKRHDYFTSCLPWPQKGDAIDLPLGTAAPVTGLGKANNTYTAGSVSVYETGASATKAYTSYRYIDLTSPNDQVLIEEDANNAGYPGIYADLTSATASTINELRQAFQLQKLLERDARGGTRYVEIIRSHFGVTSPDARLQRPEYLGGGTTPVNFHPVPQMSETNTTPQGTMSGFATVSGGAQGFTKSFTEHCVLIGLVSLRADLTYQQGLDRMFSRRTRYDFYWPSLSHIGEQAVLNKEIYMAGSGAAADDETFGYQERYAEYRYKPSRITGLYRSSAAGTLEAWHASQDFGALPTLGTTFITEDPPIDRLVATPTEPHLFLDTFINCNCTRPMPTYSVPGMIDHF